MLIKAQIQFTRQQIEFLDELRQQTGETRTELVRRAVDYYIPGIREHGVQKALPPIPTTDRKDSTHFSSA
ncbi:MAG: ribbon-helix-helix protein, CopG family [Caldilineaceae bacterium]|nr:ribbon-helix-helix protein, CopG family [Caldilineaceae bacterium]